MSIIHNAPNNSYNRRQVTEAGMTEFNTGTLCASMEDWAAILRTTVNMSCVLLANGGCGSPWKALRRIYDLDDFWKKSCSMMVDIINMSWIRATPWTWPSRTLNQKPEA